MLESKKIRKEKSMNYSDYRFSLDIQIHQAQVSVPVTLNDTARKLYIGLTDGRKPYTINDGCRAVFAAKKPDGTTILNDCIVEKNSTIVYPFSQNTTNCVGVVNCEVRLYDASGKELTSPQFIIVVDEKVVRDEEVSLSESEATAISNILATEQKRVSAEIDRASAESARVSAHAERESAVVQAESDRKSAEDSRVSAENGRVSAENQRVSNETQRDIAESERAMAEITRKNAEDARSEADAERGARMDQFDEAVAALNRKLDDIIDDGKLEEVLTVAYPVGAIYMSVSDDAPASLFGGTWEKLESRFLLGSGNGRGAGTSGGSESVTLGEMHLPSNTIVELHNNTSSNLSYTADAVKDETITTDRSIRYDLYMPVSERADIGLGAYEQEAIDTMPPFYTVHMWKRIA
jgi:hypothetical protein